MSKGSSAPVDLSALSDLAPELAEMLVSVACDIALVLDDRGIIKSVALGDENSAPNCATDWVGQRLADTVTVDMRRKAESFLHDLANSGATRTRHLSHRSDTGPEISMAYTAVRLGDQGPTLAVGRDMRLVSAMQQRLTETQREIERDYWQRRQIETRYRHLFQVAAESMVIVNASTYEVLDANRSAAVALGHSVASIVGRPLATSFASESHPSLYRLLDSVRVTTRVVVGEAVVASDGSSISLSISPFRNESGDVLCVVLHRAATAARTLPALRHPIMDERLVALFERSCDAIALCGLNGNLLCVNDAFMDLVDIPRNSSIDERNLSEWLVDDMGGGFAISELVKNTSRIRLLKTHLRRKQGGQIDVEISGTLLAEHDCVGVIIRVCHAQGGAPGDGRGDAQRDFH